MENMRKNKLDKPINKIEITDEDVIEAIKLEADSFVPDDLSAIEKATGTFNPFKEREDLTLTEKFHNEGNELVPNLQKEVLEKAGVKPRFSFRSWMGSHVGVLAVLSVFVASGVTTALLAAGANSVNSGGTLITVSFSAAASKVQNAIGGSSSNSYTPSFTFYADKDNKAESSSLICGNYSASLVKSGESSCFTSSSKSDASLFASSLVKPSYSMGYLANTESSNPNGITISYLSTDSSYLSKHESSFREAFDTSLKNEKTYATIAFKKAECSDDLSSLLEGTNSVKAKEAAYLYYLLSFDESPSISMSTLINEDEDVLTQMASTYKAVRSARLSPTALNGTIKGSVKAYEAYKAGGEKSTADIAGAKNKLVDAIGALPWASKIDLDFLKSAANDTSYYLFSDERMENKAEEYTDATVIDDEPSALGAFFFIRDESLKGLDKDSYLSLLVSQEERAAKAVASTSASPFPDGFDGGASPDPGGHGSPNGSPEGPGGVI